MSAKHILLSTATMTVAAALTAGFTAAPALATANGTFIGRFSMNSTIASTVPANGDVNPYGVAVVQQSIGMLRQGSVLVSNFNDARNYQGTGTTIVQVAPAVRSPSSPRSPGTACLGTAPAASG